MEIGTLEDEIHERSTCIVDDVEHGQVDPDRQTVPDQETDRWSTELRYGH